jgi:hypothetical protein
VVRKELLMKFESQLLKGVAPVVVLEILSRGQMYGYELSRSIEERSGDILSLGKGTLYPLLYNLEAKKLVEAKWEETLLNCIPGLIISSAEHLRRFRKRITTEIAESAEKSKLNGNSAKPVVFSAEIKFQNGFSV